MDGGYFGQTIIIKVRLLNIFSEQPSEMMFKKALKIGFYDLQGTQGEYRLSFGLSGMNIYLLQRFIPSIPITQIVITLREVMCSMIQKGEDIRLLHVFSCNDPKREPKYTHQHRFIFTWDVPSARRFTPQYLFPSQCLIFLGL